MPITRRNRKHDLPMHASTCHGLHEWHKRIFEKLGWMVLAKAKGYDYKIAAYKKEIHHLLASIEHVMKEYKDPDRIHDLNVLHRNVECLKAHVAKDF